MRLEQLRALEIRPPPRKHRHPHATLTRRGFLRTAGGAALTGAVLGTGVWRRSEGVWRSEALAQGSPQPQPILDGSPAIEALFGQLFHTWGPASIDPVDAQPATITDFNGNVGLAYLSGDVIRTNTVTGETQTLPFVDSDMRFMQGTFRATDGSINRGTFGFI